MTGIDKIIEQIGADAAETARTILAEAKNSAHEEKSRTLENAVKQCAQIRYQSDQDVRDCLDRAKSAGVLKKRQLTLTAKQELIREIIDKAHYHILKMPDDDYFAMLLEMIEKFALSQQGKILFSAEDYQRLPEAFQDAVSKAAQKVDGSLVICDQKRPIDGGFILDYGEIEVNCSFSALFNSANDRLQDRVNEQLFLKN